MKLHSLVAQLSESNPYFPNTLTIQREKGLLKFCYKDNTSFKEIIKSLNYNTVSCLMRYFLIHNIYK